MWCVCVSGYIEREKKNVGSELKLSVSLNGFIASTCTLVQVWMNKFLLCRNERANFKPISGLIITGVTSNDHIWTYQSAR